MDITGMRVWFWLGILRSFFYAYQILDPLDCENCFFFLVFDAKGAVEKCVGCFLVYPFWGSLFF